MFKMHKRDVRRMGKQLISFLLIITMVFGLIPQSAYAVASPKENSNVYESEDCRITYTENSTWGNYVNADITIQNEGKSRQANWKLSLTFDGTIENIWNADILSCEDGKYILTAKTYNSVIEPGQSVSFGLIAHGADGKPEAPKEIKLVKDTPPKQETDSEEEKEDKKDDSSNSGNESAYRIPEQWKALNYALFTSAEQTLSLYTYQTNIIGSIHSNQDFYYQGTTLSVDGVLEAVGNIDVRTSSMEDACKVSSKMEQAERLSMPDITGEVASYVRENGKVYHKTMDFQSDSIVVDRPLLIEGAVDFHSTHFLGSGILYATDSINYNVGDLATPENSRVFVASENGNITLNGSEINLNAVLYAPNGCVTINANRVNLNGRIIAKQVCINGTIIHINAGPYDLEMLDFLFDPEIEMNIEATGNRKENRKIILDVEKIVSTEDITKNTVWKISRKGEAEDASDCYAIDEENSDAFHKEMLFTRAGTYEVSVTVTNGKAEHTVTKELVIEKDLKPVVGFTLPAEYVGRNKNGKASIRFTDSSYSPDNDAIGQRIWTVYYDRNNDGKFSEDEAEIIHDGNETELDYSTSKVGKYKVVLRVVETFTDTIPKLLAKDAFQSDDTMEFKDSACIFEVGNEAPQAKVDIQKSKSADIVFTLGDTDKETLAAYNEKAGELKKILEEKGVDAKIDTISVSTLTAQDTFAWKEYDHYDYKDLYLPTIEKHILYEENDIKMLGYSRNAMKDFLYVPNNNPGQKIFEFDLQRDHADWHSMEGGGFLFNTMVDDEKDTINGFCILVSQQGLKLIHIAYGDNRLGIFHNGYYNSVQSIGRLLRTYPIDNLYDNHHFKIAVDAKSLSVWDGEKLVIDNYILPEHDSGYGFGPIISHNDHGCPQQSYFTFKNITMQTMNGSSLSDIVDGYDWRPGASHYVINLSNTEVPELSSDEEIADLAAALIENQAAFIGIGNDTNENQYRELLATTETGGMYEPADEIYTSMDTINSWITDTVLAKDDTIETYITTDDMITYQEYYQDAENDEIYEQRWEYEYDPSVFGETGEKEHIIRKESEPLTVFENTGAYRIRLNIRDNPAGDNDALDSYRKWSKTEEYEKLLIVQSRPQATVKVEVSTDEKDETQCIANATYSAQDADHPKDTRKGIRKEYFYYKNVKDGNWTEGKLPNRLTIGETYLVKYQVKDVEGTLSFPAVFVVKTSSLQSFKKVVDNLPPEVYIDVAKTEIRVGEELRIDGYALDDYGVDTFEMYIDGKKVLNSFGRHFYRSGKEGTVTVEAVATDIGGNTAKKELTITVVDGSDKTAPTAVITSPTAGSQFGFDVPIIGTAEDETKFANYTLSYRAENEEEYHVFKESNSSVNEDILGIWNIEDFTDGTYEILLTAEDAAGNVSYCGLLLSIETGGSIAIGGTGSSEKPIEKQFAVNLSHHTAGIGTTVQAQVTLPENVKEESVKISIGEKELARGTKKTSFTSDKPGQVIITAAGLTTDGNIITAQAACTFYNLEDKNPPTAEIISPEMDTVLTEPVDIVGSAWDEEELDSWKLEYRMDGEKEYLLLNEGREPVKEDVLGHLDTTMLMNGKYNVKLTVQDKGGHKQVVEHDYMVEGNLKIGAMHIGFTDITASLANTTVNLNRVYDSRDKTKGEFGYGWTLGMQGMELYENESILEGYTQVQTGNMFSTGYQMEETLNHDVMVSYGDGSSDRFQLTLTPRRQALIPIFEVKLGYQCVTNPKVKLEIIGDTTAYVSGGRLLFYNEALYDGISYKLTTEEGAKIYLNKEKGVYKIEDNNGNVITVDKNGYHSEDGKSITLKRDSENRVISATDPAGNVTTYAYDTAGDLVSVKDCAGRTVSFAYDKKHNLISITDSMGQAVARNEYDDDGRLIATIDADGNRMEYNYDVKGRTQSVKDRRGNTTVYTYDNHGNVLQTIDAYGNKTTNTYDSSNHLLTTTDANGNTTSYTYDESGNVTGITAADGTNVKSTYTQENLVSSIQMMDKTIMAMEYDDKGRIASVEDANGNATQYSYTNDGKLMGITDAIGTYQKVTYDSQGNVVSSTNGAGESAFYTYDKDGKVTSITISREENGEDLTFTSYYSYNAAGDITESIDNAGNVTKYEYDNNGNQTASVDAKGRRIIYAYDELFNMTKITYPDGTFETFTYDANGNNLTATDRSGFTVTMQYDKLDRMTQKVYADGTKETYAYDAVGNVIEQTSTSGATTVYAYDERNRNISITDALGNITTFTYDEASKLTKRTDARNNSISYEYDDNGNIIKTTYPDGNSVTSKYDARNRVTEQTDQNGNSTSYTYDGADRLTKVGDAYGNSYTYSYDENGNLIMVTDAEKHVTRYTYDAVGRVKSVTNALGKTMEYSYDETGNLKESKDYAGTITTYDYDGMDRLVKKTVGDAETSYTYSTTGLLMEVRDDNGTVQYQYDTYGRLAKQTDVNGITLSYTYDKAGRLESFDNGFGKTTYEYDILDRITRVIDRNGKATVYVYDELGNRSAVKYPNGNIMTYTYDACQRLKEEYIIDEKGVILARYSYGLGKAGERLTITENVDGEETKTTYQYDKLNRLVKETIEKDGNQLINEYAYDKVSNRLGRGTKVIGDLSALADTKSEEIKVIKGRTSYIYNALNQLIYEGSDEERISYEYDDNGNLIRQIGNKTIDYSYDKENHLLRATIQKKGKVTVESYTYDYAGNRLSKTVNESDVTYYVNDTSGTLTQVVAETDKEGKETASYTRGDELVSMEKGGNVCYYLYDGHGSTRLLTDETGKITDRYAYDAYGNLLQKEGDSQNDFLYTGEQYNANTGLYYLRARYMNPSNGTFISMDSYQGSIYDPVSLHKYLYANANPVMYTDPSGYFSLAECSVVTSIQSTLSSLHEIATLHNIIRWANALCTVYDVAMEIRGVLLGERSIEDVMAAILQGLTVEFMCSYMCTTALGIILKPMVAIFGLSNQVDRIQEAFKKGDPVEITVRIVQLISMVYGLTSQCFTGETLVSTKYGLCPIEEIQKGDYVWSENSETGEKELKKVLSISITETATLVHVITENGTEINTTENHPFYVEGKGWVAAAELESGDMLRTQEGKTETVFKIETEKLEEAVKVYNLEIEDNHTYYVSEDEVLVHNECGGESGSATGNRPPNLSPEGAGRNGAYREAKRKNNIPMSEQPKVKPNVDKRGKRQPGKIYEFENGVEIRDDAKGHKFPDNPTQNRGPHFNDSDGNHYDY